MADEYLAVILDDIKQQAELEKETIENEIKTEYNNKINSYKNHLLKKITIFLEEEFSEIKAKETSVLSKSALDIKNNLLKKRKELVSDLFTTVYKQLLDFTLSEKYKDYLSNKLSAINEKEGVLYIKKGEGKFYQNTTYKIIEDNKIKLGGFIYRNEEKRIEYDLSLDNHYEDEIARFKDYSNFMLGDLL